ncbi:long-chain-fatty-acid--CoA ligase [Desulfosarcina alkanivorans]|uniref:Long-chain-fatty-acid--CoA ligase n=1 Tax=Desulfosarcina alkanivorans TaxID=571177 RepID=A0A5K7YKH3_9BACT|nr:AMP-binding protein [Desulfosarcina alkanivorans]BBO69716.1 long-chain-fatty-acid--CoA ligase [Desulfosarcina alkanivorans]
MVELIGKTLPQVFLDQVALRGDSVGLREKDYGIWQRVTWRQYFENVRNFSLGLKQLGFERGDHMAILSENCCEWLYSCMGIISLGGVALGVYSTSPCKEVHYVVKHSDSVFVLCEDQEQTDKILEVIDDLPKLKKIIVKDMKGLRNYPKDNIISFAEVAKRGLALAKKEQYRFQAEIEKGHAQDVCIMIYTSGTTGPPKGAMVNHRNIEAMTRAAAAAMEIDDTDSVVSYLPLCHVAEQIFSLYLPLYFGVQVNFAESIATIQNDLREIAPTVFLGVPRIWEKLQNSIIVNIQDSSWLKQNIFNLCMKIGYGVCDRRLAGKKVVIGLALIWWACYGFIFRALQNYVGLRNVRLCFSAAAKISPEVLRYFHAIGIRVKEGYGMTECTGLSFIHKGDDIKLGTVGKPLDCITFKLAPDGELMKRGPSIFSGYYKNPAATTEAIVDGWLMTGDIAEVHEDGHLAIVDRKKDILITSGGKNIAPSLLENELKVSPFIKEAIILGDDRKFVSAMIQIDFENVGKWATDHHLAYTNFKSLSKLPEVHDLIQREVDEVNEQFARVENVRKFLLLTKELDHDDDELTATMKVRRANIYKKFSEEIQAIYGVQD